MNPEGIQSIEWAGVGGLFVCVVFIFFWIIAALFLLWGASLMDIRERSFGKAMLAIPAGVIVGVVISLLLGWLPVIGQIIGAAAGILGTALAMIPIFRTTFVKGLGASALAWLLSLVVTAILGVVLGLVLAALGIAVAASGA